MMPAMAFADSSTTYNIDLEGFLNNTFTLENVSFDSNKEFHLDNTKFDHDLAITSLAIAISAQTNRQTKKILTNLGFEPSSVRSYDYNRTGKEEYMTGYSYATKKILRDGEPCNLVLVAVNSSSADNGKDSTSGWNSIIPDLDFLNHEMDKKYSSKTDFYSTKALTFTKAAEQILDGSTNVKPGENLYSIVESLRADTSEDYLVWVTGQSRGGAIGNYLSKLLVDNFGTEHVVSYLFSVPNVDKEAASDKNTAKYSTIFNVANPDDVVTYVPFGVEGGKGWGFARWGVDIPLGCIATADPKVINQQAKIFAEFTKTATKDKIFYVDGNYYGYSKEDGNGIAIKKLVGKLAKAVPDPYEYYTGDVSYGIFRGQNINILSYLIDVKDKKESEISLFLKLKSAATQKCDLNCLVTFAIKHLVGYSSFEDMINKLVIPNIRDISNIKLVAKETYIAHAPENYLLWLVAENMFIEHDEPIEPDEPIGDDDPAEEEPGNTPTFGGGYIAKPSCKLTFDANGHGKAPYTQNIDKGRMAIEPKDPEAEGFIFGGWFIDKECTVVFDFLKSLTKDTTVYAKWTEEKEESLDVQKELEKVKLSVRTSYNKGGDVVVKATVAKGSTELAKIREDYTVQYKFCRSTKKSSNYKKMFTTKNSVYTNTKGIHDKKYYYKAVLLAVDSKGNTVAKTELKNCSYGYRIFHGEAEK